MTRPPGELVATLALWVALAVALALVLLLT